MIGVRIYVVAKGAASGSSGRYLGSTGSGGGVLTHALTADRARLADEAKRAAYAAEADHARTADDFAPGSVGEGRFVRKDRADSTPHRLGVGELTVGSYVAGLSGAYTDARGNSEFESITARSFLKVFELIYNRINALEGDYSFSDSGTIEELESGDDGVLSATMRKRWEGDFTAFQPGDIVYGYVNDLTNTQAKTWGKAWALVTEVDRAANVLTLVPYRDIDVPSGVNLPVTAEMLIARWGNVINPESEEAQSNPDFAGFIRQIGGRWVNTRQRSFLLSSDSGSLMELVGVDAPVLREGNIGTVLGQLPTGLLGEDTERLIDLSQPYLYARGIIVQDLIRIGYKGVQTRMPNFRGAWSAQTAADPVQYYRMADDLGDMVSHAGALWQCLSPHADEREPSAGNPQWLRLTGDVAVWSVVPSSSVIYVRGDVYSTRLLECTVIRNSTDGTAEYHTPEALDTAGMRLEYSLDGTAYGEYWVREGETLELDAEDGTALAMGGNNIPWYEVGDNIFLRLLETATGTVVCGVTVPVVRDGADGINGGQGAKGDKGDPGSDGKDGISIEYRYRTVADNAPDPVLSDAIRSERAPSGWVTEQPVVEVHHGLWQITGRIGGDDNLVGLWDGPVRLNGRDGEAGAAGRTVVAYPAGVFDRYITYRAEGNTTPVVLDGKDSDGVEQYYYLRPGCVYCGNDETEYDTPALDAARNPDRRWERMDRYSAIFADIIMAKFGKIGSAVFYDQYMMSQQGTDAVGREGYYEQFPDNFVPNFLIDFETGKVIARDLEWYGTARQKQTVITKDNYRQYVSDNPKNPYKYLLWTQTGGIVWIDSSCSSLLLKNPIPDLWGLRLPNFEAGMTAGELYRVRAYIGTSAVIYNESTEPLTVTGNMIQTVDYTESGHRVRRQLSLRSEVEVGPGMCREFRCSLSELCVRVDTGTVRPGDDVPYIYEGLGIEDLSWEPSEELAIRTPEPEEGGEG